MTLLAVLVVRDGVVPAGAEEACAEANGRAVVVGSRAKQAALSLRGVKDLFILEAPTLRLRDIAHAIAGADSVRCATGLILPASPDGRDLAALLAHQLDRPLFASAIQVREHSITCVRTSGRVGREVVPSGPFLATLVPGVRGLTRPTSAGDVAEPTIVTLCGEAAAGHGQLAAPGVSTAPGVSAESIPPASAPPAVSSIAVLPPDPATMDLTEARSIIGGGLGLGSKERFDQLGRVARFLDASVGGTRVASDAGWIPFERQIGTTGVSVSPSVYLAFGISGATQHTSGLGNPDHVLSVNTDPSCPMMTMADVAIVSDAAAVLDALERKLSHHASRGD